MSCHFASREDSFLKAVVGARYFIVLQHVVQTFVYKDNCRISVKKIVRGKNNYHLPSCKNGSCASFRQNY